MYHGIGRRLRAMNDDDGSGEQVTAGADKA